MPEENKSVEEKAPVTIDTDPIQDDNIEIRPLKEGELLNRAERTKWEEKANEILDKIRPYIQHDGGDCELLGIDEEGIAYVTFLGACAGCMMAGEDFSTGIRLLLLDEFPELKEVVLVG
ncbi:NifU family protein [Ileibacterium valens]|uniref:NifU family protein n=1 Tax=Ileibacterium valens TaxID=1862668 RepID=UPI0009F8CCA3|nr:NifU family protein [Ileibacterium valens]